MDLREILHDSRDLGQRLILLFSFSGSSRNMIQHCQDALAINHHFHGADLFLTMTTDPNWPEITEALLPGQTTADRPSFMQRLRRPEMIFLNVAILVKQLHMSGPLNIKSVDFLTCT